ncbi:MAG: N-acetylmuramoyl-L-alanine amidase [Tissierellia bacterium]|nr:N-acetylmuramoyl-L-alanine amidase [Tissierellia bacterium]
MKIIYIKKKQIYILLFVILMLFIGLIIFLRNKSITTMNRPISNKIIGIDPGHGGIDPGTVSKSGVEEAEINLKIALKLKEIIRANGGNTIITRENEKALADNKREDLEARREIIERELCDIFLTIHLNSFTDPRYYGAQVFYKKDSQESILLADCIQEEMRLLLDEDNTRVPQERDDVYLIRELDIPAVLVECGFLSNPQEEKLLKSENYQRKIAQGIYNGIIKFLEEMERRGS